MISTKEIFDENKKRLNKKSTGIFDDCSVSFRVELDENVRRILSIGSDDTCIRLFDNGCVKLFDTVRLDRLHKEDNICDDCCFLPPD